MSSTSLENTMHRIKYQLLPALYLYPQEHAEETDLTKAPEDANSFLCLQLCRGRKSGNGKCDVVTGEQGSAAEPQHCRPQVRKDVFS